MSFSCDECATPPPHTCAVCMLPHANTDRQWKRGLPRSCTKSALGAHTGEDPKPRQKVYLSGDTGPPPGAGSVSPTGRPNSSYYGRRRASGRSPVPAAAGPRWARTGDVGLLHLPSPQRVQHQGCAGTMLGPSVAATERRREGSHPHPEPRFTWLTFSRAQEEQVPLKWTHLFPGSSQAGGEPSTLCLLVFYCAGRLRNFLFTGSSPPPPPNLGEHSGCPPGRLESCVPASPGIKSPWGEDTSVAVPWGTPN